MLYTVNNISCCCLGKLLNNLVTISEPKSYLPSLSIVGGNFVCFGKNNLHGLPFAFNLIQLFIKSSNHSWSCSNNSFNLDGTEFHTRSYSLLFHLTFPASSKIGTVFGISSNLPSRTSVSSSGLISCFCGSSSSSSNIISATGLIFLVTFLDFNSLSSFLVFFFVFLFFFSFFLFYFNSFLLLIENFHKLNFFKFWEQTWLWLAKGFFKKKVKLFYVVC